MSRIGYVGSSQTWLHIIINWEDFKNYWWQIPIYSGYFGRDLRMRSSDLYLEPNPGPHWVISFERSFLKCYLSIMTNDLSLPICSICAYLRGERSNNLALWITFLSFGINVGSEKVSLDAHSFLLLSATLMCNFG